MLTGTTSNKTKKDRAGGRGERGCQDFKVHTLARSLKSKKAYI